MKKYRLADLKRDAASGKIVFEMIEWYGRTGDEIPERLRGIRKVDRVNTVGIYLSTANKGSSFLGYDYAALFEYDRQSLTIYNPGKRDMTEEEKAVLDKAKQIEDEYYKKFPIDCLDAYLCYDAFWTQKAYFKKCSCPWMSGWEMIRGKKYDSCSGKVIDKRLRGEPILIYKIHWLGSETERFA